MTINKYLKQSRDGLNYSGVYAKICKNTNKNTINFHKVLVHQSLPVEDPKLVSHEYLGTTVHTCKGTTTNKMLNIHHSVCLDAAG